MPVYEILYEDDNFLAVNKFSGLLVHKTKYEEGNTLIDLINVERNVNYFLVHRIDKFTSGIVLVAKNNESLQKFNELFMNRKIEKYYVALTESVLPAKEVRINLSLGKSKGNKLMFSTWNAIRYKKACTHAYKLEKNLVLLNLMTGRTHQIRAHLFSIKCPILNDPVYSKKPINDYFGQYLHAYKLEFQNPFNGDKKFSIILPPPKEFLDQMEELSIEYEFEKNFVIKSE